MAVMTNEYWNPRSSTSIGETSTIAAAARKRVLSAGV